MVAPREVNQDSPQEPADTAGETGPNLEGLRLKRQEQAAAETSRDMSPLALVGIVVGVIALVGIAAGILAVVTHGFHKKTVAVITYRPRRRIQAPGRASASTRGRPGSLSRCCPAEPRTTPRCSATFNRARDVLAR